MPAGKDGDSVGTFEGHRSKEKTKRKEGKEREGAREGEKKEGEKERMKGKKKGEREGGRGIGQREGRRKRNHFFNSCMLLALHQVYKDVTQFCQ